MIKQLARMLLMVAQSWQSVYLRSIDELGHQLSQLWISRKPLHFEISKFKCFRTEFVKKVIFFATIGFHSCELSKVILVHRKKNLHKFFINSDLSKMDFFRKFENFHSRSIFSSKNKFALAHRWTILSARTNLVMSSYILVKCCHLQPFLWRTPLLWLFRGSIS